MRIIVVFLILILFCFTGCSSSNTKGNNANIERLSVIIEEDTKNVEEIISTFSTTIYIKESGRQNNIQVTCSRLNNAVVKANETFSFCDTVGKATADKGYQKAQVFDSNGNIIQGYGGGNCQISSTLYNAVLQVSTLEVVERYPHSRHVDYVEEGKDAAVAYGSVDFKFKNNNPYDIRIDASATEDTVTIKLVKI